VPSGLLHDENVRYYHPADDLTEYTKTIAWTGTTVNFVPSILISGIQPVDTAARLDQAISPNYNDIESASGFTMAVWTSGFLSTDSYSREVHIGFGNNSNFNRNSLKIYNDYPTIKVAIVIEQTTTWRDWTPAPSADNDWHLIVADARYETSGWRCRVSLDRSGWTDLGIDSQTDVPGMDERTHILILRGHSIASFVVDEMVSWGDNDLFTTQELSNLYELYNTYNTTMDQYTSTFGTPADDNIDCFICGSTQTSENITLYIPGQKDVKSIDLFTQGNISISGNINLYISGTPPISSSSISLYLIAPTPVTNNINLYITGPSYINDNTDHFIQSHQILVDNINQYIQGYSSISGNINLYISGVPAISSLINLYIIGPVPRNNNIDHFTIGHLPISGNFSLFTRGHPPDINVFVSVVENNPSNNFDLFIHGVPSGESTIFYTNNTITFFINDNGEDATVDSDWFAFVKVADAILISHNETWQSFVQVGNAINDNINLYINSHASGDNPHGPLITNSLDTFVNGRATQDGDEGLLSDGYYVANLEISAFTKVHLGLIDTLNFYVSGEVPTIPPSAILDLFIFGILDIVSDSYNLYIPGKESVNEIDNLFIFGIQDIGSGNLSLYLGVTDIGLLNQDGSFYLHGF